MPGLDTSGPNVGGGDLDDLFNYDIDDDVDKVFRDIENKAKEEANGKDSNKTEMADLGIDEEIQVKKARKPIPKLDENRLLSERGIPKLRRLTRERLKLKGKGHEFHDVARMLRIYQLWLDDLYPRAKFLDSLAMVEKLGHSKSIQVMRKDWINEGKPKDIWPDADPDKHGTVHDSSQSLEKGASLSNVSPESPRKPLKGGHSGKSGEKNSLFLSEDEEELDALLAGSYGGLSEARHKATPSFEKGSRETAPEEDELDALLNEHDGGADTSLTRSSNAIVGDDFTDEMEAMADLDMW